MASLPFALQLYTVRDHLEKDPVATLERVKEIGYDYVELAGFLNRTPKECRKLLDNAGLVPVSAHVGAEMVASDPEYAIRAAKDLDVEYIVIPWMDASKMDGKDAWLRVAEDFRRAGERLGAEGVRLCYHNHDHEFRRIDGDLIMDLLLGAAAGGLEAELDVYWITYAGEDPVEQIRRYQGRCPLLHIKDMSGDDSRTFTEVGRGIIDMKAVFREGTNAGARWFIVEQDVTPGDALDSAHISAEYMAHQSL